MTFENRVSWFGAFLLVVAGQAAIAGGAELDFNRDVRPILSDKCFHCHGPDADNQDSSFRLDTAEHALEDLGGYAGVVAFEPEESELIVRIESDDEDLIMPPADAPRHLTDQEKQVLRRWIAEGANYQEHWSFVPPQRPNVPAGQNAIDFLVRKRLAGTDLKPSPQASRRQLIRRVTLDLTGLPPTPSEVNAFVEDRASQAYERVVDRLLASPAYGERMAQIWLDAARYADSAGYQNDFKRTQWPWRDWVIDAYNQNMPFDRFSTEQLAGDLLPAATDRTRLATAFNRNHRINNEGGIIPEEFLVEYVADRVETTSTVWLGLTTGCARCHDHKYDPIKMKDFYQLFAFFHNLPEKGKDGNVAPAPNMNVYTRGSADEHEQLKSQVAGLEELESEYAKEHQDDFEEWLNSSPKLGPVSRLPKPSAQFAFDYPQGKSFQDLSSAKSVATIQGREGFVAATKSGKFGQAVSFQDAGHVRLGKSLQHRGFDSGQAASWSFFVKPLKRAVGTVLSCTASGPKKSGYQVSLISNAESAHLSIAFRLVNDGSQNKLLHVQTQPLLERGSQDFYHVAVAYDGSQSAGGVQIYVDGKQAGIEIKANGFGQKPIQVEQDHFLGSGLSFAVIDELYLFSNYLSAEHVAWLSKKDSQQSLLCLPDWNRSQRAFLERKYFSEHDSEYPKVVDRLKQAEKKLTAFEKRSITQVSIMEEMQRPRDTYLLLRGDYAQPDKSEVLEPTTFESLPPMTEEMPRNRLGLAMWLFHEDNPLTARVAVNRYWQMLFGAGIVKTPEDFGSQGAIPTHPDLLDWLAFEFRESGWNTKALLKRIVMSETYCQDSRTDATRIEIDPTNELLSRGPRFRLSAFAIRDQALAASGLLARRLGGPPVMPYQPAGLWDEVSAKGFKYVVAKDEGLYRRSLYTFWRRTVPPPSMMNFDNAGREACSVNVSRTNTPLQAINLMNDPQFVEAARALGERMIREAADDSPASRISKCCELVLAREPEPCELKIYLAAYQEYYEAFASSPENANELVQVGNSEPDARLNTVELATCAVMASVFLNLDETVTKE